MARLAIALIAGILFGLGLTISHMVDPTKVLGFLDLSPATGTQASPLSCWVRWP